MKQLLQLLASNVRADRSAPAIRAESDEQAGSIYLYDVIDADWGASALDFIAALDSMGGKDIKLHINSPGGDVFEARAMVAAVRAYPGRVDTYIDGWAASAATYLALSGQTVNIIDGGMFMIHNSWTMTWGDKHDLLSTADVLDKIDVSIRRDYARKTGKDDATIAEWMDAETWFTAEQALAEGFVDVVMDADSKASNSAGSARSWNLSAYKHAPQKASSPSEPGSPDADQLQQQVTQLAARQARLNRSRLSLLR